MSELGMNEAMMPERADQQDAGRAMTAPGAQLAAHRKALGWSIEDVADQLKLAPRQVVALEADNYALLPGMAIVRGFIRAYAKILRIDPLPLVAMIAVEPMTSKPAMPLRHEMASPFSEVRLPSMNRRGLPAVWLAGLIIVVLLIVILGGQHMGWVPSPYNMAAKPEKDASSAPALAATASMQASNSTAAEKSTDPAASVRIEPNVVSPEAPPKPVVPAPIVATAVTPAVPVARPAPTSAATNNAANANNANNALVLKVRQDSWVEIKRANGTALISRVVKAGSTETFDIKEPVQLIIGNVAGVDASLRGTVLQMKTGTGNTARLNLK